MPPNNPFLGPQPPQQGAPLVTSSTPAFGVPPTPGPQVPNATLPPQAPVMPGQPTVAGSQQPTARPASRNPNSTQNSLQLSEVRENMVVMLDGSFRAVVACQSINFDLMSDREREGVEYSYQNFLNSLNFPIQILVRSQRVDIGPYIEKLLATRRAQDNMLLGVLMDDYINFIDILSQEANIMEKTFYIVVPYFPLGDAQNFIEQGKGFFGKLFSKPKNTITKIDTAAYQKAKDEIGNRVDVVRSGLAQIGVQSVQLDTKSLGELYYNFYNPDTAVRQPIGNFENVTGMYIKKGAPNDAPQSGGVL